MGLLANPSFGIFWFRSLNHQRDYQTIRKTRLNRLKTCSAGSERFRSVNVALGGGSAGRNFDDSNLGELLGVGKPGWTWMVHFGGAIFLMFFIFLLTIWQVVSLLLRNLE